MNEFLECTALITGASAGIGREFALQLAPYAGTIILLARRTDRLEALRAELLELNPGLRVLCETVDLADAVQVSAFCERLHADGSELDFLINNAGFGDAHAFEDANWPKIDRMLQVNIVALTALCRHLIPLLRRHRPGAILNVSSVASILPVPGLAVYAATKAYVSSFTEALRAELRGTGITVSQLCPGPVDTEFQHVARDGLFGEGAAQPGSTLVKVTAAEAARAGLRAVARDRARVFPGLAMQLTALLIGLTPLFILRYFLAGYHARARKVVAKDSAIL